MINYHNVGQFSFNNCFFNYMKWKKISRSQRERRELTTL